MSTNRYEKYGLLQSYNSNNSNESIADEEQTTPEDLSRGSIASKKKEEKRTALLVKSLILSALVNLLAAAFFIWAVVRSDLGNRRVPNDNYLEVSSYTGLGRDPEAHYPYSEGYGTEITNHSLLDERWESIDINLGIVAIGDDWAKEHNLPDTQRFPWDTSKGVYLVTAFHTLHCLKNIHRLLYEAHHGRPFSRDIGHAMHCLDHMRKDAMCEADDFLLPSPPSRYGSPGPRGQSRVCKNWDALVAWGNQHSACYQHITDDETGFAEGHAEVERYANCPPSSPYYQKMQDYFARHGKHS